MRESNPLLIGMLVSTLPIVWLLSGKKGEAIPVAFPEAFHLPHAERNECDS